MMQRLRSSQFLLVLFILTSVISAWPWPPSLKDLGIEGLIIRRQSDNNNGTSSSSQSNTSKGTSTNTKTPTPASRTGKGTNTAAATSGQAASASGTQKGAAKTTGQAAASSISVNPVLPPGGVNMLTPTALAQTTYYKIGDHVSFAWNYTSLSITPSKIDVVVTCTDNGAAYSLQTNATFQATDSIVWDTGADATGTAPLPMGSYTLMIYDAGAGPTAAAAAGRLGTMDNFRFGMYIPQPYTPRAEWRCAVCSAALSDTERQAMKFMVGMCLVTILSFTWFVSGLF